MSAPDESKDVRLPFIRIWVDDFVSSPKVQAMTTEEIGAYFLLLLHAWSSRGATVPASDKELSQITKLTRIKWKRCRSAVLKCFELSKDGASYKNDRLEDEWRKSQETHKKRSTAGRDGANKKHGKSVAGPVAGPLAGPDFCQPENAISSSKPLATTRIQNPDPPSEDNTPAPLDDLYGPLAEKWDETPDPAVPREEFIKGVPGVHPGWNDLKAAIYRDYKSFPKGLIAEFDRMRSDPEWWAKSIKAMEKMKDGFNCGAQITLKTFLKEDEVNEIVGTNGRGKYDWIPGGDRQPRGVGLNAISAAPKPEGGSTQGPIGGEAIELTADSIAGMG